MTQKLWRTYAFGYADFIDGKRYFFNRPGVHSKLEDAWEEMTEYAKDPVYDGAFLVECEHESYFIRESFGTDNVQLTRRPLGNFVVERVAASQGR